MRILLINPPSVSRDLSEVAPPLGLYSLIAVANAAGIDARVWDGNVEAVHRNDARFYAEAAAVISEYRPTMVGVTSMVVNSHIALNTLRGVKEREPGIITVAGGPHFSSFAHEAARSYSWIDHVVQGEGERAFETLLQRYAVGRGDSLLRVLREPVSSELLNRARPSFADVQWATYFKRNGRRAADYESSRGCVFNCSFCYSPSQWGRSPRYVSDDVVINDLRALERHGVRHVFFVDDNFVNDPERASRLCDRFVSERVGLRWLCYATLNRLDSKIIGQLAGAGCDEVFVGIDAVAAETQREFRKRFFKSREDAVKRLSRCIASGITPTCALIVRGDAEDEELDDVVGFAAELRTLGCSVRLNPLIGYQGTSFAPRSDTAWYTESRVRLMLDDSALLRENSFARAEPHLFPYHCAVQQPDADESHLREVHAAATVIRHFPKTVAAMRKRGEGLWCRIREIAAAARATKGTNLRRSERKIAMQAFQKRLGSSDAGVPAAEFALSALPSRSDWIQVTLRGRDRDRVAEVRPFVLDETGVVPSLLIAAFEETVRTFELEPHVNRKDLKTISAMLQKRSSGAGRVLRISRQTVAALRSADLLRLRDRETTLQR
jgi:radical SAM superfamily enzyme YgiQ (UPF0313 family)